MRRGERPTTAVPVLLLAMVAVSGALVPAMAADASDITPLAPDRCAHLQAKGVITANAPVPCERLRAVAVRYIDFSGATQQGEIVVLDAAAASVRAIFGALYARKFALHKIVPMEHYGGDDRAAMEDNNSSAFNARPITGGSRWSLHAYGAAIDINPRQNPFISKDGAGQITVLPHSAAEAGARSANGSPGKPPQPGLAEEAVDVFADHGFVQWGGDWKAPVDYQHFQIGSRAFTERLARATPAEAQRLFDQHVRAYRDCKAAQVAAGTAPGPARLRCAAQVQAR